MLYCFHFIQLDLDFSQRKYKKGSFLGKRIPFSELAPTPHRNRTITQRKKKFLGYLMTLPENIKVIKENDEKNIAKEKKTQEKKAICDAALKQAKAKPPKKKCTGRKGARRCLQLPRAPKL